MIKQHEIVVCVLIGHRVWCELLASRSSSSKRAGRHKVAVWCCGLERCMMWCTTAVHGRRAGLLLGHRGTQACKRQVEGLR
jgi:hypothetical protein